METQAPPKRISEAQTTYIRKLAHAVTGDGNAYVASLQAKYPNGVTSEAASAEIKSLKSLQGGARPLVQPKKHSPATTSAPAGRYAVELPGMRGSTLVEITKPTSGQWNGYTFVKTVPFFEGGNPEPIKGKDAILVLKEIEMNPRGTAAIYGQITGRCGQCNRRLSDPSSVAMGIGPECMNRF